MPPGKKPSVLDVTGQAQWSVSGTKVLEVSATGLAKGIGAGEAFISVRYQSRSASKSVLVLPAGTYRLKGRVTDDGVGLEGVTMTSVIGGPGAGHGHGDGLRRVVYVLYGVGGHVRLQAKRADSNAIRELDLANHRTFDVEMTPDRPRTNLQGRYTLTLTAVCPAGGSLVGVNLPRSVPKPSSTERTAAERHPDRRGFHPHPRPRQPFQWGNRRQRSRDVPHKRCLFLLLLLLRRAIRPRSSASPSTSALVVSGTATATPSGSRISGELAGDIGVTQGTTPPFTSLSSHCYSPAHRFQMIRH